VTCFRSVFKLPNEEGLDCVRLHLPICPPTNEQLGKAILGWKRRQEFGGIATLCESHGMPKVCPIWGGRYAQAVMRFFDMEYGLATEPHLAPGGKEGLGRRLARRGQCDPLHINAAMKSDSLGHTLAP
jgi:hypothetical protein